MLSDDTLAHNSGAALYKKAKQYIPGGTQLLSKRPEMFLPDRWPSFYAKCKGAEVWDLDGNHYIDMSINGVGACILGYADDDVNQAVINSIGSGSMCTLNCPEEFKLAELLCSLHPWAEMVRYARCGGEAMAIASRIVRAAAGRDKIAFCGYHGWHDWYLAANLADDKNLDGQLLPGLEPAGVPRSLLGSVLPFHYGRPDTLDRVIAEHHNDIAAIIMEPVRHHEPDMPFLRHVRETARKIGAILVFDEITSGWRMNVGGIHLLYNIEPDMAVFAKGISNGYPMAAVIGKRAIMEAAQKTFISSTYWTERIGPVAAIATIQKMKAHNVPDHLCSIGNRVRDVWKQAALEHGLNVGIHGIPPLSTFSLEYGADSPIMHTLFTRELLKRGYLASKAFYATFAHSDKQVIGYAEAVNETFAMLSRLRKDNMLASALTSPIAHSGFKRLA